MEENNMQNTEKQLYEKPAIIYEGELTTRAGTTPEPIGGGGINPEQLFGSAQ